MQEIVGVKNTASNGHVAALDHLRSFAIIYVMLYHYRMFGHPAWVDIIGQFGWTGVDLFFVLSGYLIAAPVFKAIASGTQFSIGVFLIKRFFRIIPAYLFVVAVYFLIPGFREKEALPPLWRFLTFTQNFGLNLFSNGTFSHAWSLCIEEQFYFLFPLAVVVFSKNGTMKMGWLVLMMLFLVGVCSRIYCWQHFVSPLINTGSAGMLWYQWIYYPTWSRLDGIIVGICIAASLQFTQNFTSTIHRKGKYVPFTGGIILILACFLCSDQQAFWPSVFGFTMVALGYGCLVFSAVTNPNNLLQKRFFVTSHLATLSYSMYLCHKGAIHFAQQVFSAAGVHKESNLMLVLCLITTIIFSLGMNLVIEKPFLKLRSRILAIYKA